MTRPPDGAAASLRILALCVAAFALSSNGSFAGGISDLHYYYAPEKVSREHLSVDVCVYGGTSGGVAAAVQAARLGKQVVLLEFGRRIGGLTSGGLCATDGGRESVCGGIAREFYNAVGQEGFTPHSAEQAYEAMLTAAGVDVRRECQLSAVQREGTRILSVRMENGLTVRAEQYIDCTYEGDLMAMAGVSYTVGREASSVYGERYNGVLTAGRGGHNFPAKIDPYRVAGDPSSGLLPRVNDTPPVTGAGDQKIQAFCFRMWLTQENPAPFPKPDRYDEQEYEILARLFESGADPRIQFSRDTNNHHLFRGAYFIDYVGGADAWPEADYATREEIFQEHLDYQLGVMWFLQNSPRIPEPYREEFAQWGLPRDIYVETGGWTHQLYVREGRRMVSDYVMTEHNCTHREWAGDSIGLASYNMDSHHCQMTVVDGAVRNEGNIEISPAGPYPVAYRAITPRRGECTNLLVPWSLSSSHIAFGSIRMEPVFMILGQSAGTAASLAIDDDCDVQRVEYDKLKRQLLRDNQILDAPRKFAD